MVANYLLSLDLGTTSIGYVVFGLGDNNHPSHVIDVGVRIFPDGRDSDKKKTPLAVGRRIARGIRRTRDRGQNRIRRLVKELIQFDLLPSDEAERKHLFDSICPYKARHIAVNEMTNKETLARALFHLGRRRGFKSNRLSDGNDESDYKNKINALREMLDGKTLGEHLYQKILDNKQRVADGLIAEQTVIRFRGGETEFYADRAMYQDEFDRIREQQGTKYLTDDQWEAIRETVFWQYPLRPVPKGKCRFYPDEQRAHIDLPISHQYRIYQEINALRYQSQGKEYSLDERQRTALYDLLDKQISLTFKSLKSKKDQHKSPLFPSDAIFNLDYEGRGGKLLGNKCLIELRKPYLFGDLADSLSQTTLNDIVHHLIEPIKTVGDRQVVIETDELESWLAQQLPTLSIEQVKALCRHKFKRDTAGVSRKFMEQINPVLKDKGCTYDKAVALLESDDGTQFHHSHVIACEYDRLPYYGRAMPESVWGEQAEADKNKASHERDEDAYQFGKIANPTVHLALNQLRFVVNQIIDQQGGKPSRIHIELTRDLKNSKKARDRISKQQALNRKNNDRIRKFLADEFNNTDPSRDDMQKIKLWEELGKQGVRQCVFTGNTIGCGQLFSGEVEVEHIIPFSRCYDDGMGNKTLAFKSINNRKLNRTPDEAFEGEEYKAILHRAYRAFGNSPKYKRFKQGAFDEFYGGEKGDMIARQIKDTQYISKKAAQYLRVICPDIVSINGHMTAVMRDVWNLNRYKDREEGHYRDDHRHHIVDAFVAGLTSRALIQSLMTRRSGQTQTQNNLYHFLKNRAPEIDQLKHDLDQHLDRVIASYKPDRSSQGSMYNDTAYGLHQDQDGKQVGVTRKSVASLSYEEVFRVRGQHYRTLLIDFLAKGEEIDTYALKIRDCSKKLKSLVGNEKQLAESLQQFANIHKLKTLRIDVYNDSVQAVGSAPYKGYALNGYAYCDVWQIPHKRDRHSGKWSYRYEGSFVAFAEVNKYQTTPKRPIDKNGRSHPAAKRLMRLYKHDSIALIDIETGEQNVMKVAGYSASRNKIDIRQNLLAGQSKQNFTSINVIFQANKVHKFQG